MKLITFCSIVLKIIFFMFPFVNVGSPINCYLQLVPPRVVKLCLNRATSCGSPPPRVWQEDGMYIYLFCQNRTIKLFDFYLPSHPSPISSVSPIICVGNNSGAHRITIPQSLTLTLLVWSLLSWITFMDRIGFCPSFSANFLPVLLLLLYIWQIDIGPSNIFQFGGCPWPLAHISGWLSWHLICAPGLSRRIDWTQLILFCPRHILRTTQLTFQRANNTFTTTNRWTMSSWRNSGQSWTGNSMPCMPPSRTTNGFRRAETLEMKNIRYIRLGQLCAHNIYVHVH